MFDSDGDEEADEEEWEAAWDADQGSFAARTGFNMYRESIRAKERNCYFGDDLMVQDYSNNNSSSSSNGSVSSSQSNSGSSSNGTNASNVSQ